MAKPGSGIQTGPDERTEVKDVRCRVAALIAKYGILDEISLVRIWCGFGRTGADLTWCGADFAWCGAGLVRVSPGAPQPRGFYLMAMIKPSVRQADRS